MNSRQKEDPILEVIIVGFGFGGLIAAKRLLKEGIHNFLILEKASSLGGTWRDNTYPGCGCDVPSHLYSLEENPKHDWDQIYASQKQILDYLNRLAQDADLLSKTRFDCTVESIHFDHSEAHWMVNKEKTEYRFLAKHVILATGPLNQVKIPSIPGYEKFQGETMHSAEWDSSIQLNGKKVVVVGTGASAIQIVPSIAEKVEELHVLQRTAPWILPRKNRKYAFWEKFVFRSLPIVQKLYRHSFYLVRERLLKSLIRKDKGFRILRKSALDHLKSTLHDQELVDKMTPDYPMGCKRILQSQDYVPCFNKAHVHLWTEAIDSITEKSILLKGDIEIAADVIIWATGFYPSLAFTKIDIVGLSGHSLFRTWLRSRPKALKGIALSDYPQLYLIMGPNTGLPHNSVLLMMESQAEYIIKSIRASYEHPDKILNVNIGIQEDWSNKIQRRLSNTMWSEGHCKSWYLDNKGNNFALWSKSISDYRKSCNQFNPEDYELINR